AGLDWGGGGGGQGGKHDGDREGGRGGSMSRKVAQIDLVPTLSLLLGNPIPYGNLGGVIPELFLGPYGHKGSRDRPESDVGPHPSGQEGRGDA
ncbi:unnamed protein product, partial [Discosporangium mesarthrocarpum]